MIFVALSGSAVACQEYMISYGLVMLVAFLPCSDGDVC